MRADDGAHVAVARLAEGERRTTNRNITAHVLQYLLQTICLHPTDT